VFPNARSMLHLVLPVGLRAEKAKRREGRDDGHRFAGDVEVSDHGGSAGKANATPKIVALLVMSWSNVASATFSRRAMAMLRASGLREFGEDGAGLAGGFTSGVRRQTMPTKAYSPDLPGRPHPVPIVKPIRSVIFDIWSSSIARPGFAS
jgi:hypothetical protein